MENQEAIRMRRQTGTTQKPPRLSYGEMAVAKDGTVYAGNEKGIAVEADAAAHTAADAAQSTANAAMPKAGGAFAGAVTVAPTQGAAETIKNSCLVNAAWGDTGTTTAHFAFVRK